MPVESIESKKYTKRLHHLLLKIFQYDLEDPIFKRVTINHVKINRNKTFAYVYLDLMSIENSNTRKLIVSKLNRLNSLFKSFLVDHFGKYRIPTLRFVEDRIFEKGQRIEKLIKENINGQGN